MTAALHTQHLNLSLEDRRDQAAARYSRTSKERVEVAREVGQLELDYSHQGGRGFIAWLETSFAHGTAVNLRNAGRALSAGLTSERDSVTELAELGRLLQTRTKQEAQTIQQGNAARRVLAEEAGIGLATVPYPSDHVEEVAEALVRVKQGYQTSNLTVPDTAELMLTAARIVNRLPNLPAVIACLEGTPAAPMPADARLTPLRYYSYLAGRLPRTCQHPRCGAPASELHHVPIWDDLPKRGHALETANVLDLCLRHHQTGGHAAAHGHAGLETWAAEGWGSLARLYAAVFREYVLWTHALLETRTSPEEV